MLKVIYQIPTNSKIALRMFRILIFIFILTISFSCNQHNKSTKDKIRRVIVEDVIAEGEISADTIFNGLIKFYDTTTNQLVIEAHYKNGNLNGPRKDYYLNGKLKNLGYYENGMQTGMHSYFDSTGQLALKQDYYFNLRAGNRIEYKNGKPIKYYFTSFDNKDLFYINYDSVYSREIEKINDNSFFFWHTKDVATISTNDNILEKEELFVYLINPPEFNFEYSLCIINSKDSILRTEKVFEKGKIWNTYILDQTILNSGERFALRLAFDRDFNDESGEKGDMLKRL